MTYSFCDRTLKEARYASGLVHPLMAARDWRSAIMRGGPEPTPFDEATSGGELSPSRSRSAPAEPQIPPEVYLG